MPISAFVWVRSFIEPDFLKTVYGSTIYHSNLSDQSALEIRVRIRVRLRVALFQHFSRKIRKMSTFSSANVTDGSRLVKEHTHTINNKIKLHIIGVPMNKLGNWLIFSDILFHMFFSRPDSFVFVFSV